MLTSFSQIFEELRNRGSRKRMIAAWGVDGHTIAAASKAIDLGLADVTLVGPSKLNNKTSTPSLYGMSTIRRFSIERR